MEPGRYIFNSLAALTTFMIGVGLYLCWYYFQPNFFTQKLNHITSTYFSDRQHSISNQMPKVDALSQTTPLPCARAKEGETQPWVHNSEILSSFPKDDPLPQFLGVFQDKAERYKLRLYRDAKGIFGTLSTPLLPADSPTSPLSEVFFNPEAAALQFQARFGDEQLQFTGRLHATVLRGTVVRGSHPEAMVLRRIQRHEEYPFISRAQFDCAMLLYKRY